MKAARPLLANLYVSNNKPSPKLTLTIHFLHWNHSLQACRIFSPPTLYMHCICQKNSLAPTLFQRSFSLFWFLTCKYFASVPKILVFAFVCYGSMHFCPLIICVTCFCLQALCVCPVSGSGLACYSPAFCLLTAACDTLYRAVHAISLVHSLVSLPLLTLLSSKPHTHAEDTEHLCYRMKRVSFTILNSTVARKCRKSEAVKTNSVNIEWIGTAHWTGLSFVCLVCKPP